MNDYDYEFHYHLDKTNKVDDDLSRKVVACAITIEKILVYLQNDMCSLEIEVVVRKLSTLTI